MRFFIFSLAGLLLVSFAQAGLDDVTYPVLELGSCENQESCFEYCNQTENYDACLTFAEENQLLEQEEIEQYRSMQEAVAQGGPGGCDSETTCEAYCDDLANLEECLTFAESYGLMDEEELDEARKVQTALDQGYSLPGGCTQEEDCEAYCSQSDHLEECLTFAQAAGLITQEEITQAETFLSALAQGETPGGCQNQDECEEYCTDTSHTEECLTFAVSSGFMTQEEADELLQMDDQSLQEFIGPGGCTDEESCRAYCEQETHWEECAAFFGEEMEVKYEEEETPSFEDEQQDGETQDSETFETDDTWNESWTQESDATVGPGGCTDAASCEAFCSDSANQEICFGFSDQSSDQSFESDQNEWPDDTYEVESGEYEGFELYEEYDIEQETSEVIEKPMDDVNEYLDNEEEESTMESFESGEEYQYEGDGEEGISEYPEEPFDSFDPEESTLDLSPPDMETQPYEEMYVEPGVNEGSPTGESGGEPQSAADVQTRFVEFVREFVRDVMQQTKNFLSI